MNSFMPWKPGRYVLAMGNPQLIKEISEVIRPYREADMKFYSIMSTPEAVRAASDKIIKKMMGGLTC